MLSRCKIQQQGLSLIELMIGIVVGMIVVGGVTAIYVSSAKGGADALRAAKLNQELRAVMDVMVNDIRRAGHFSTASSSTTNPFVERNPGTPANHRDLTILTNAVAGDCLMYSYDATHILGNIAGSVDATDFFGFRQSTDRIEMLTGGATSTFACAGSWEAVTDPNTVTVTSLRFSTVGSRCLNVSVTPVLTWQSAPSSVISACEDTGAPTYTAPTVGNRLIEIRVIEVTLAGTHRDDPTTRASLTQQVRVMNDRFIN